MANARKDNLYFGVAGQFAVMSELLARGYHVARPDVDVGEDIITVEDGKDTFTLVQVKAANTSRSKNAGLRARYLIREDQITRIRPLAQLYFAFVIRSEDRWVDFVLVSQEKLRKAYRSRRGRRRRLRSPPPDASRKIPTSRRRTSKEPITRKVSISLVERDGRLYYAGQDWSDYRNNWDARWPKIETGLSRRDKIADAAGRKVPRSLPH